MTSDERKTLEALADAAETVADVIAREDPKRMAVSEAVRDSMVAEDRAEAAAIRSALATIDALTQQVRDLEARAIPQWWIHRAFPLEIRVTFRDGTGHSIALNGDGSVDRYDVNECGDHHGNYVHSTLAAALRAATEAT